MSNPYNSSFQTSNEMSMPSSQIEETRARQAYRAKQKKVDILNERQNQFASLDDSYTDLGDGVVESNRNKIWNDMEGEEYQNLLEYTIQKYSLNRDELGAVTDNEGNLFQGKTKRLYEFEGKTNDDIPDTFVKFGIADGRLESSEARYTPNGEGYGWESGFRGVDTTKKNRDVLLPADIAVMLEGLAHGRKEALKGRAVPDIIGDRESYESFGSGGSEYYNSREALFGKNIEEFNPEVGKRLFEQYKNYKNSNKAVGETKEEQRARIKRNIQEYEAKNANALDRAINTVKGFGSTFVSELLINPADAVGDLTGWYDIGSEKEKTEMMESFSGYNPLFVQESMDEIGKQWEIITDKNASNSDKLRAVGNGVLEAFLTPELLGTSLGALLSWVTPGTVLKGVGVGAKFAAQTAKINKLQEAGKLTAQQARVLKLRRLQSVEGAKDLIINQSGYLTAALGNVNNQYEEFVQNNNGKELEGGEKAAWFASRLAIQVVNQNVDKIVDVNIIKSPAFLATIVPAVKGMTNKEFAKVAKNMGKGAAKTFLVNPAMEAAQEYSQTMMEVFNSRFGSEQFSDVDTFVKFITDERNTTEAGIAAIAGAGGSGQFEVIGATGRVLSGSLGGIGNVAGAAGQKILDRRSSNTSTENEPETVMSQEDLTVAVQESDRNTNATIAAYADMVDDVEFAGLMVSENLEDQEVLDTPTLKENLKNSTKSYSEIIQEVEAAETVIENRKGTERETVNDELALRLFRKTKAQISKNIIESEKTPVLGSGYSPEDVVEDYLATKVNVEGNLDVTEDEKTLINKFLKSNGQKPFRFKRIAQIIEGKDAKVVYEDSMGVGKNSAPNRRARLKKLVNTTGVNKKLVDKEIKEINNFLTTQKDRKEQYEITRKSLQADIDAYNKNKNKPGVSVTKPKKTVVEGLDGNYLDVQVDAQGNYKIKDTSKSIIDSVDDTIDHLETTLNRYNKATTKILGTTSDNYLAVPVSNRVSKAIQESREKDKKFYDEQKPTKVIVDEDSSPVQWKKGKDYQNVNETKLVKASSEFNPDDKVLLTTLDVKAGSAASKTLSKAIQAGATILVDRSLLQTKNKQGVYVNNKAKIQKLAKRYKAGAVTVDGALVFKPRAEATKMQAENRKQAQYEKKEVNAKKKLKEAFDNLLTAKESKTKNTTKENEAYKIAKKYVEEYFPESENKTTETKIEEFLTNQMKKEVDDVEKTLMPIMIAEGTDSKNYSEAAGKFSKTAIRIAQKRIKNKQESLAKGGKLVKEWKEEQEKSKKTGTPLTEWSKKTFGDNVSGIVKKMLSTSAGKKEAENTNKIIYSYIKKGATKYSTTTKLEEAEKFSENGTYTIIEVDPSKYVEVGEATIFNTLDINDIKIEGEDNVLFNNFVETSLKALENALKDPDRDKTKLPFTSIDSPASSLIYDENGKLNANFAVATRVALYNFIRNNSYLLTKDGKTLKDIAEILGKHESELSMKAIETMQDKGLMVKTAADSIGKDIAKLLGIRRKNNPEVDIQAFNALVTEFGQIALVIGASKEEGLLKFNSMPSNDFAKDVLGKKDKEITKSEATVNFIDIRSQTKVDEAISTVDTLSKTLPGLDVRRKEPSFVPINKKQQAKASNKPRKESLGINVANESKEAMEKLTDTEMSADMPLLRQIIDPKNSERIKKLLGFIEIGSDEFKKLSYKEQQTQASKNREVEQSIAHLVWLNEQVDSDKSRVSMWFNYFFSKNGRFFIDSNTINPQNDKHLHRFIVQALENKNTFDTTGKKSKRVFKVGDKDVTASVHYALAQAFGFATDKKKPSSITAFTTKILSELDTVDKLESAREAFLNGEESEIGIKMEHLGHAMQGFDFIEKMLTNKPFESSLSAEFDAVTSGFGLKILQMPIIGARLYEWLSRVGVVLKTDKVLETLNGENLSMNSLLDTQGFLDSYQSLAKSIKQLSYKEMKANSDSNLFRLEDGYAKNLWEAVSKVLPQVKDDVISSDLRNLFKYPFMTFNYASSVKSIRQRLKISVQEDIAKQIAAIDLDKKEFTEAEQNIIDMLNVFIDGDVLTPIEDLQEMVREKPLYMVKVGKGASLGKYLEEMVDASYGKQVEDTLNEQFDPFISAQDTINNSFKALFEVFIVAFEEKLLEARKQGVVSVEKEKEIYESLKDKWPAIRGPLSNLEEEFSANGSVGIYSSDTASPFGVYAGRKAATTTLSDEMEKTVGSKTLTTSHMIRSLSAAISAGSVIPIHYIDGAIMGKTINQMGGNITSIHDAIIPSLLRMEKGQEIYNREFINTGASYSYIDEIVKSLDRVIKNTELYNDENPTSYEKAKIKVDKKEVSAADYIISMRNEAAERANQINDERKKLFDKLNEGAYVMHMAGTKDGVYEINKNNKVEYNEIKRYVAIPNKRKQTDKKIADDAINLC